jgi:DNA polymerase-3 subunit delta'
VVGPRGSGKTTLARAIAGELLGTKQLGNHPYYRELGQEPIGIEQVRGLREFMRRKTTGTDSIRRVCILDDIDTMTREAANALLKTLEEPADDTVLVLTAESLANVPKTVQSRAQVIHVQPIPEAAAGEYFAAKGKAKADIIRAHAMSEGRPALMAAILDEDHHPLVESITLAKQLLASSVYERLTQVDALSKDREAIDSMLFGLERIATTLVYAQARKNSPQAVSRAHKTLQAVTVAQQHLQHRANTKLLLTNLFITM